MPAKKALSNYSRGNLRVARDRAVSHRRHRCLCRGLEALDQFLGRVPTGSGHNVAMGTF